MPRDHDIWARYQRPIGVFYAENTKRLETVQTGRGLGNAGWRGARREAARFIQISGQCDSPEGDP